eukprot:6243701-Prymnesium_polylepis.1
MAAAAPCRLRAQGGLKRRKGVERRREVRMCAPGRCGRRRARSGRGGTRQQMQGGEHQRLRRVRARIAGDF